MKKYFVIIALALVPIILNAKGLFVPEKVMALPNRWGRVCLFI